MRDPYDPWADERAQATPSPTETQDHDAIRNCHLCDTRGLRDELPCRHIDHAQAAKRGLAHIRAQMGWNPPPGQPHPKPAENRSTGQLEAK